MEHRVFTTEISAFARRRRADAIHETIER